VNVTFSSLSASEKATALAAVLLMIVSLVAGLFFVGLLIQLAVTKRITTYWNACFLLCAVALGSWMLFYTGLLWLGGGVMFFPNNLLLFWFLACAVLVSAALRFANPERYVAMAIVLLSLAAFEVAGPSFLRFTILLLRHRQK
jgi:hypothetical protein